MRERVLESDALTGAAVRLIEGQAVVVEGEPGFRVIKRAHMRGGAEVEQHVGLGEDQRMAVDGSDRRGGEAIEGGQLPVKRRTAARPKAAQVRAAGKRLLEQIGRDHV